MAMGVGLVGMVRFAVIRSMAVISIVSVLVITATGGERNDREQARDCSQGISHD